MLSNINAGTSRNELDTYFVEGFDLSSTTLKCVTTHKIVFVRNNALANYEIINLSRSPKVCKPCVCDNTRQDGGILDCPACLGGACKTLLYMTTQFLFIFTGTG